MSTQVVLAIDIGASKTLLTARDAAMPADAWRLGIDVMHTGTPTDPELLVDWIVDHARELGAAAPAAIGVAAPGPVDRATGIISRSSNLRWENVPIGTMLRERLTAPAALEDDANTAALGEWHFGAGGRVDPFAYLTISSGIGGGVVVGETVVRGAGGNAGEVGHIVIDPDGPACACGRRGDIESYAGGAALERRALETWPDGVLADGGAAPRTAAGIFEAARRGDPLAQRLVDDAGRAVAMALAAFAAVLEPRRVVVGGSIGLSQDDMVRRAAEMARARVMAENGRSLEVWPATLGSESVLAGAVLTAQRLLARD